MAEEFAAEALAEEKAAAKKQTIDSAAAMLKDGLSADKVAKYTRLTIEEVHDLMKQVV